MDLALLNLSWQVEAGLVSGYASYFTATTGNRANHRLIKVR
jgi:hypothetical protein